MLEHDRVPRYWPKRVWDPDAFRDLLEDHGTSEAEVELAARLRQGRFAELEDNGFDPYSYELWRIAYVLGLDMGEVFDAAFTGSEPGR